MTVTEPLPPDPYKALGVGQDAALAAIKSAYRKLALQCHPDKVLDPTLKATKQDEFQRVQQAYEILSDETKKREYDDDVKLRRLREEVYKHAPHPSSAARPPPKNYYEYNVRTAEPPPSFRPGPPPAAAARSPYATGNAQFSGSWDREIPTRSSKNIYDEDRKPRRTASHEKASRSQEELKDERRRRDKADDDRDRRRADREAREAEKARDREREREKDAKRERQRERERAEQREKERERERQAMEKEKRKADEKRIKKEREREREKMEKEADRLRKQQQEEKFSKKAAYVEHHDESDDNHRTKKASGSNSKKHVESPRSRDKSGRRDESPRTEAVLHKVKEDALLGAAAEYMHLSRRKGPSKSGTPGYYPEQAQQQYSSQYRDPEEWRPSEGVKSRRPSHDDKYNATVEDEPKIVSVKPQADPIERPPRLQKAYTFSPGSNHMPNTSAPRQPHLSRAATMDTRGTPPAVPQGPEPSRHSKSDRRRRDSAEDFDDRPRRSMATHRMHSYQVGRDEESPRVVYRQTDEVYAGGRGSQFDKVKMQTYSHEPVYSTKRFQDNDVAYSNVPHSASYGQYSRAQTYA